MSDREAFEKKFMPSYCHWDGTKYAPDDDYDPDSYQVAHRFNLAWQAWQAAQAQAGDGRPVAKIVDGYVDLAIKFIDLSRCKAGDNLYLHPQPAAVNQQLLEALKQILGWRELRSGANEVPIGRIEDLARAAIAAAQEQK